MRTRTFVLTAYVPGEGLCSRVGTRHFGEFDAIIFGRCVAAIGQFDLFDAFLVHPALEQLQILTPIRIGIVEQISPFLRATHDLVIVAQVIGISRDDGSDLPDCQNGDCGNPTISRRKRVATKPAITKKNG